MGLGGATEELLVILRANTSDFQKKIGAAEKQVAGFSKTSSSGLQKFAALGGVALAGAAAATVAIGVASIHAADDFEKSQARLETAIANTGGSFEAQSSGIAKVNKQLERVGFNNTETEDSLARLVTGTGDVTKSMKLMGLAADIAKARNISLRDATDLLVKVEAGRYTVLGRTLGVSKAQVLSLHSVGDAVKLLEQRFGGSAQRASETFAGKMEVLNATVHDLFINIGTHLVPIIETLASGIAATLHWFEENTVVAKALGLVVGAVLVPAMAAFIALKTAAVVSKIAAGFDLAQTAVRVYGAELLSAIPQAASLIAANLGLAASEDTVAASAAAAWLAVLGPVAVVGAAVVGLVALADAFGFFDDNVKKIDTSAKHLAQTSLADLTKEISAATRQQRQAVNDQEKYNRTFNAGDKAAAERVAQFRRQSVSLDAFNKVLKQSPELAGKFIAAMKRAGVGTAAAERALKKHEAASIKDARAARTQAKAEEERSRRIKVAAGDLSDVGKALDDNAKRTKDFVDHAFDAFDAVDHLADAQKTLKEAMKGGTLQEQGKAIRDVSTAAGDAASSSLGPLATATQKSETAFKFQLAALQQLRTEYPQQAGPIDAYIAQLQAAHTAAGQNADGNQIYIDSLTALRNKYPELSAPIDALIAKIQAQQTATAATSNFTKDQFIGVLDQLKARYPQVAGEVQALIDKLNSVPPQKATTITADASQANGVLDGLIGRAAQAARSVAAIFTGPGNPGRSVLFGGADGNPATPQATGGPVEKGRRYLVGERGPEMFVPHARVLHGANVADAVTANAAKTEPLLLGVGGPHHFIAPTKGEIVPNHKLRATELVKSIGSAVRRAAGADKISADSVARILRPAVEKLTDKVADSQTSKSGFGKVAHLATGGTAQAGTMYVVGERGPEVFAPSKRSKGVRNLAKRFARKVGHLAGGGHANEGDPYVVGERGPELFAPQRLNRSVQKSQDQVLVGVGGPHLFVPPVKGTVIPNHQLRATSVQRTVDTLHRQGTRAATVQGTHVRRSVTQLATGGNAHPRRVYLVGERGPELFVAAKKGSRSGLGAVIQGPRITPTRSNISAPSVSAATPSSSSHTVHGTGTYKIEQHIAPGVDPAEVGRHTVNAIKAYERRNGKTWRK